MGYLTKFGTVWGVIPETCGNVFFVAPVSSTSTTYNVEGTAYNASDGNDGRSPERALATITQAITNCTANNGDMIVCLPGVHNLTSAALQNAAGNIAFSKAGISIVGLPRFFDYSLPGTGQIQPLTTITAPAATIACSVTAADITFSNLRILPGTTKAGIDFTTAANRLTVRGCFFDIATVAGNSGVKGLAATGATQAPVRLSVTNCTFEEDNTGTSHGVALDVGASTAFIVKACDFHNLGTGAGVAAWTAAVQVNDVAHGMFRDNDFYTLLGSAAAITGGIKGVSMTGASELMCWGNRFGVTVTSPITGFAGADVDLLNNYVATVAGGTGGTLITSTT